MKMLDKTQTKNFNCTFFGLKIDPRGINLKMDSFYRGKGWRLRPLTKTTKCNDLYTK